MDITLFAKRAFTNTNHGQDFDGARPQRGHLLRVSSIIRADQMAEWLGAKLNPTDGYADDVCIYVKPHVKSKDDFDFEFPKRAWLDIIAGWALLPAKRKHPEIGIIACSHLDGETLRSILPNRVVVIPQHHCNFERVHRTRKGVSVVGVIGTRGAFKYLPAGLEPALAERGLVLEKFSKFFTRQDVIDFYQRIDVQIGWRPYRMRLANPLKLVNAAAFGVPTIALREEYFDEMEGSYYPVKDLHEILGAIGGFQSVTRLYTEYSAHIRHMAERYHIDRIAEMYRRLE